MQLVNSTINHSSNVTVKPAATLSLPRLLLSLEGLVVLLGAIALYARLGANGWLFAALLLVPDLAMIGYLRGPRLGALTYNLVHSYTLPVIAAVLSVLFNATGVLPFILIWFAHIGMDRTVGYGLKYASGFKDNHLGRV